MRLVLFALGAGLLCAQPIVIEFVKIQPGEFQMGCGPQDAPYLPGGIFEECPAESKPSHLVRITRPFELGKYEVTQQQWQAEMATAPAHFKGDFLPVEQITWDEIQEFLAKLTARHDGYRYRLPTEAEWEYAARAGSSSQFGDRPLAESAWYDEGNSASGNVMTESPGATHPVGGKLPNAWGLYDMLGNVAEWVSDWYSSAYYKSSPTDDPQGPPEGQYHISRGGSWFSNSSYLRVWNRYETVQVLKRRDTGFRVARESAR